MDLSDCQKDIVKTAAKCRSEKAGEWTPSIVFIVCNMFHIPFLFIVSSCQICLLHLHFCVNVAFVYIVNGL